MFNLSAFSLRPRPALSEDDLRRGLRSFTIEGAATMGLGSITGSGLLAAYALILGANNFQIGVLAALPFLAMPLQVFTVGLVENIRRRKVIAIPLWALAQSIWIPIALIPVLVDAPGGGAISMLLGLMAMRSIVVALQNPAWNSWIRDLVPQSVMGTVFARRLRWANLAAMSFGMGAALFVDFWRGRVEPEDAVYAYTIALLTGAILLGTISEFFRAMMPEPSMQGPAVERRPLFETLIEPFKDSAYRPMLVFQFLWAVALHLAVPFFAVYMLNVIGLPVSAVLAFAVLSQLFNVIFLRVWGPLVDRMGNKAVLSVSASLYVFVILGWTFTTMPDRYFLTIPLLIVLHMLAGAASAGATLTTGTIGFKLAPEGKATAYVAAVSIVANLGAGAGPLIGGGLAEFFRSRTLSVDISWVDPARTFNLPAVNLTGFDFLFVLSFVIGILTLNLLTRVVEEGEAPRADVMRELFSYGHRSTVPMSTVPGMSLITQFPLSYALRVPGLDAALGVTAYQVAETTRLAAAAAGHSRSGTRALRGMIREAAHRMWAVGHEAEEHASEFAQQAARGAMLSLTSTAEDVSRISNSAVHGVLEAIGRSAEIDAPGAYYAATYGAVQGAIEAGADPNDAASGAEEAVVSVAQGTGIAEEEVRKIARDAAEEAIRQGGGEIAPPGSGEDEAERIE